MSIADTISVEESAGITFLVVDNEFATAKISLFGGHVLSFAPKSDGIDRLWVSPHAYLNGERPIRGGIPVCWPWFSDDHGREKGALPSHGFLRNQVWQLKHSEVTPLGTLIQLTPSFSRADGFEYDCQVVLDILVGETLIVSLITRNTGVVPFSFNAALHTYFSVPDIQGVMLQGLSGDYKDKLNDWQVTPTPSPYRIQGETDRIHQEPVPAIILVMDEKPLTRIESENHDSVVIWNPWQGAASISDMDAFGFKHMVCIETAATKGVKLAPDETHTLTQRISAAN